MMYRVYLKKDYIINTNILIYISGLIETFYWENYTYYLLDYILLIFIIFY